MKNWISDHLGELISVIVIVVGNIVGYAKLLWTVLAHGEQLKELKADVETHIENSTLHRGPDFEQRLEDIRRQQVQMNAKLDRLLERRS